MDIKKFEALDLDDQILLRAAAFAWGAVGSLDLYYWLQGAGILREQGKFFTQALIKDRRDFLASQGFLAGPQVLGGISKPWTVTPEILYELNSQSMEYEFYQLLVQASSRHLWSGVNRWELEHYTFKILLVILQCLLTDQTSEALILVKKILGERQYWENSFLPPIPSMDVLIFPILLRLLPQKPMGEMSQFIHWIFESLRYNGVTELLIPSQMLGALEKITPQDSVFQRELEDLRILDMFLKGEIRILILHNSPIETGLQKGLQGLALFLAGQEEEARVLTEGYLKDQSMGVSGGSEFFLDFPLFPFQALWFLTRTWAPVAKFQSWFNQHYPQWVLYGKQVRAIVRHKGKSLAYGLYGEETAKGQQNLSGMGGLIDLLAAHWLEVPDKTGYLKGLKEAYEIYLGAGLYWPAFEVREILKQREPTGGWEKDSQDIFEKLGLIQSFSGLFSQEDLWRIKLDKLGSLKLGTKKKNTGIEGTEVLCWLIIPEEAQVTPVIRKQTKSGKWSVPKSISLRTLSKNIHPSIQEEDRAVLNTIVETSWDLYLDNPLALVALVGHPRIFLATELDRQITIKARDVKLVTEERGGRIDLRFSEPLADEGTLDQVDQYTWEVLRVPGEIRKVSEVVGLGFSVPQSAQKEVAEVLGTLAESVPVESPLLGDNSRTRRQEPDSRPVVQISPSGSVITLEVHISPLGTGGPPVRPGEGARQIHQSKGGEIILTDRDLHKELLLYRELLERCPTLQDWLPEGYKTTILQTEDTLEILAELQDCGDLITVLWPQGGQIHIKSQVNYQNTSLAVAHKNDWFEITGETTWDNAETLSFRALLELLPKVQGRFIPLGENEYIEIENQLLRQLQQIYKIADHKGKTVKISPAALLVSPLLQDQSLTRAVDPQMEAIRQRFRRAFDQSFPLPKNLNAELRPYQEEGYQWMSRLAEAGAGACLADDMGLGKTVQCIALLCSRRSLGPSLVIAPASVAPNWISEILKFSTDLEPVLLSPTDRESRGGVLENLGPGQILITTYGLLVTEEERLQKKNWNVLVLDEAQALKNVQTRRTKSAFGLQAQVRIALTGTPLQNHLGELWSLFEILNPGLLGTKKDFKEKFIQPIEESEDEATRSFLKNLIRPFMLRRTKNQVLQDLPPKTEITLSLEMNPQERSWYDAIYLKGLEDLAKSEELAKEGKSSDNQIRFQVLALLTKLRRACCHPGLSGADYQGATAKQEKLLELLGEMRENDHRALVFSQFTDHLDMIRKSLETAGIDYEYLDGSTPIKERTARVARFQSGVTPVFLISLGAGGVGLNLTGADYVIHMDPWWNPAIEDQASDRAHRIGQTRPVTVYRLIIENSIEEKIIDLHRRKRDLADALLEGAEASARFGSQELMALVKGGN